MRQFGVDSAHEVCIGTEFVSDDTNAPNLIFDVASFAGDAFSSYVRRQCTGHDRLSTCDTSYDTPPGKTAQTCHRKNAHTASDVWFQGA